MVVKKLSFENCILIYSSLVTHHSITQHGQKGQLTAKQKGIYRMERKLNAENATEGPLAVVPTLYSFPQHCDCQDHNRQIPREEVSKEQV